VTSIAVHEHPVNEFRLNQNYPNPFNPSTKIDFSIPKASNVEMKVYNVLGQVLATLVNAPLAAGNHTVTFDAQNLASGVYFYSIKAGEFSSVKKMMLLK
jgi:TctA family transporter